MKNVRWVLRKIFGLPVFLIALVMVSLLWIFDWTFENDANYWKDTMGELFWKWVK